MCGETNRPAFGGTIAVLFPQESRPSPRSAEASLSSSPESISSLSSSSMSSYSLFFRETDATNHKTRAIFRTEDVETYNALRSHGNVDMRIERSGDLSTTSQSSSPLYQFSLDMKKHKDLKSAHPTEMEFELPERLDLGVSEKGVIGRQVTVREKGVQSWGLESWATIEGPFLY
ncbi:uncharacterized protein N7515_007280 [Penicillium bovifimosum]|uniref:Uncharacterized protein n=1 Tax=Penicillium bovifimosum TaxID=126998 RepID=A0A9W9L1I0_9EURO|nr:uncharacterized protein N7515_007280 [Penicillium bovifimosum]KAJ5131241.1 hypothetical protein N7515_007280 [Penicillium bovifimosum]